MEVIANGEPDESDVQLAARIRSAWTADGRSSRLISTSGDDCRNAATARGARSIADRPNPRLRQADLAASESASPAGELVGRCNQLARLGQQHHAELGESRAVPTAGEQHAAAQFVF